MEFYLQNLHFHTYLAVNAKYCVYSNNKFTRHSVIETFEIHNQNASFAK